jgi:hypothetical protein
MWRSILTFGLVLLLLMQIQPPLVGFDPEIPVAAQTTISQDYLEWIHPPKWGGECEEMSVVKVTWIEPPGVDGIQPVLWVKHAGEIGAILDLSYSDLRYVERRVWAQPVIGLRDVSILRFCRPSSDSDEQDSQER